MEYLLFLYSTSSYCQKECSLSQVWALQISADIRRPLDANEYVILSTRMVTNATKQRFCQLIFIVRVLDTINVSMEAMPLNLLAENMHPRWFQMPK